MSDEVKTKVCKVCGNTYTIDKFTIIHGKPSNVCNACVQAKRKATYELNKNNKRRDNNLKREPNPLLEQFTPKELIDELRYRGYTGKLEYVETKYVVL